MTFDYDIEFRPAADPKGFGVFVLPGSGYGPIQQSALLKDRDGSVKVLHKHGFDVWVLTRYTQKDGSLIHPIADVKHAIQAIRLENPIIKLGGWGWSSGGHAVAMNNSLLDFMILTYPVILMTGPNAHIDSVTRLVGPEATEEEKSRMSANLQVTEKTPPTYVFTSGNDEKVPCSNSLEFAAALQALNRPFQLEIPPQPAEHGFLQAIDHLGLEDFLRHVQAGKFHIGKQDAKIEDVQWTEGFAINIQNFTSIACPLNPILDYNEGEMCALLDGIIEGRQNPVPRLMNEQEADSLVQPGHIFVVATDLAEKWRDYRTWYPGSLSNATCQRIIVGVIYKGNKFLVIAYRRANSAIDERLARLEFVESILHEYCI